MRGDGVHLNGPFLHGKGMMTSARDEICTILQETVPVNLLSLFSCVAECGFSVGMGIGTALEEFLPKGCRISGECGAGKSKEWGRH